MDLMETQYITASGVIKATPGRYKGAVLVYGTAVARLTVYDGIDANGKRIDTLDVTATIINQDRSLSHDAIPFSALYVALSGAGAFAIVRFI